MEGKPEDNDGEAFNRRFHSFITELLAILGDHPDTDLQIKLEEAFRGGFTPSKYPGVKTLRITKLEWRGRDAIKHLLYLSAKKTVPQNPHYRRLNKKITKLRDLLKEVTSLLVDDDIQNYMKDMAERESEVSYETVMNYYERIFDSNQKLVIELSMVLHDPHSKKGRPSLKSLYDYILEVGRTYEQLSDLSFSIYRHGTETAKGVKTYTAITPAHRFAAEAVRYMNREAEIEGATVIYTDINTYNACEAAQKKLNQEKARSSKKTRKD